MKLLFKNIFVFAAFLLIIGCDTPNPKEPGNASENSLNASLVQKLIKVGFRADMIEDRGEVFVVENDIVILKKDLVDLNVDCESGTQTPPILQKQSQAATNGVVSWNNAGNIRVQIHSDLINQTDWVTAIGQALTEWTNITNCKVQLDENSTSPHITIFSDASSSTPQCMQNLPSTTLGRARFPSGGNPGPWISLNYDIQVSPETRTGTVIHELGHALGLRHTDWVARGEGVNAQGACETVFGANQIPRTPPTDASSVMNGSGDDNTFNSNDIKAAQVLYPDALTAPSASNMFITFYNPPSIPYISYVYVGCNAPDPTAYVEIFYSVNGGTGVSTGWVVSGQSVYIGYYYWGTTICINARGANYAKDYQTPFSSTVKCAVTGP